MSHSPRLEALVEALRRLPGVGVKSAQRMAYHLLQRDRAGAQALALALNAATDNVGHCERCNTFSESPVCGTCSDASRDGSQLCVVETPADQAVIERTQSYRGLYYVLLGRINPIEGIGPRQLGLERLIARLDEGVVREVIVATNFTAEGEATSHVLHQLLKDRVMKVTRLARGVPIGSELEYVDLGTIAHALTDRR